jgi:hypothetical protein
MIPQLVRKIGRITQQRLQITHNGNNRFCLTISLVTIFDCHQMIHHLVDVATILWKVEPSAFVVVIVSHKNWFGPLLAAC